MRKALIVGINDYPGRPLRGCIKDADTIADLLATNEDGSTNFEVMSCHNLKTKDSLRASLYRLFQHDDEVSLFYFSGHGCITKYGGYLITPDFTRNDVGISMDEILTIANLSPARHKIIVLDCCYSGAMGAPAITENKVAFLAKGVTVLAASRDDEPSVEVAGQGIFTGLLAEGLRGAASDLSGKVNPTNLYSYIDKAFGGWQQRPVFKANIIESVCLRKLSPPIPREQLRKITEYFTKPTDEFQLDPTYQNSIPGSIPEHVAIFRVLRRMHVLRLIEVPGEEYFYYATVNHRRCKLTPLGMYYWNLVKQGRV